MKKIFSFVMLIIQHDDSLMCSRCLVGSAEFGGDEFAKGVNVECSQQTEWDPALSPIKEFNASRGRASIGGDRRSVPSYLESNMSGPRTMRAILSLYWLVIPYL